METLKIPPVICMLVIEGMNYGYFDNPYSVIEAIEACLGEEFKSIKQIKSRKKDKLMLMFSLLNDKSSTSLVQEYDHTQIDDKEDIIIIYDSVIDGYKQSMYANECREFFS